MVFHLVISALNSGNLDKTLFTTLSSRHQTVSVVDQELLLRLEVWLLQLVVVVVVAKEQTV